MHAFPPRQPVDDVALKQTADRLAGLLNDLKRHDWHLHATSSPHSWSIIQAPGGAGSARAVVSETVNGRWETAEIVLPLSAEQSLAARLRSIAAELEQLIQR